MLRRDPGQYQAELGTSTGFAHHFDLPTQHAAHNVVHDVQSQARAALTQAGCKKRLKNAMQIFNRNAFTGIAHSQVHRIVSPRGSADGDAAGIFELESV